MSTIFRDAAARAVIDAAYDRFRARVPGTTSRTVGTRLGDTHMLVAGPEEGPPLVMLHGALASAAHLLGEAGPLLDRFRIYAIDVLGQSVKGADVRPDLDGPAYGEWLVDVLDALALPRAHVYGVSWGGFVARKLTEHAPDRIDRLVLMVPAGFVSGSVWKGMTELGIPMALYRAFPNEARLHRVAKAMFSTMDDVWVPYFGEALRSYNLDMRVPPLAKPESLAKWKRPTLVFGASDDVSFPGQALLDRAKTLIPQAEVELLECRHSPPTDDAFRARLGQRITRFLLADGAAPARAKA
ncbi:carboxylesterase [Minicystis rosea]|nr:carboxylesterase [Minicystis rosea]